MIKENVVSELADAAYLLEKQSFFVLERTLQDVVRDMTYEIASNMLGLEKHREVMRSYIKK